MVHPPEDSVPRLIADSLLRMAEYIYTMTRARKAHNHIITNTPRTCFSSCRARST